MTAVSNLRAKIVNLIPAPSRGVVRESRLIGAKTAAYVTTFNNLGNTFLYGASVFSPRVGGAALITVGLVKLGASALLREVPRFDRKGEYPDVVMLADDCRRNGLENLLVGAAACFIPYGGRAIAGAAALGTAWDLGKNHRHLFKLERAGGENPAWVKRLDERLKSRSAS